MRICLSASEDNRKKESPCPCFPSQANPACSGATAVGYEHDFANRALRSVPHASRPIYSTQTAGFKARLSSRNIGGDPGNPVDADVGEATERKAQQNLNKKIQ